MAQEVEHILGKDEVTGSNPVSSSKATLNGVAFYIKSDYKKDEVTADARQSGGADSLPGLIHRLQKSCLPL